MIRQGGEHVAGPRSRRPDQGGEPAVEPILAHPLRESLFRVLRGLSPASLATLVDLGVPECADYLRALVGGDEAEFVQWTSLGDNFGQAWADYAVGVVGFVLPTGFALPLPTPWPYYELAVGGDLRVVQTWQRLAWHRPSGVWAEVRWHPQRGETVEKRGLPSSSRLGDLRLGQQHAESALKLVKRLDDRGRRENTGRFRSEAEFRAELDAVVRRFTEAGRRPKDAQHVADEMGISRSLLFACWKRWPETRLSLG